LRDDPAYKNLAGFDFASSEVNEAMVRRLHGSEFIDSAHNIVLIGGPGTGETHIATALGIQVIEHHRRKVRFFSTAYWSISSNRKRPGTRPAS
jgi:DNA replication protein DnaC